MHGIVVENDRKAETGVGAGRQASERANCGARERKKDVLSKRKRDTFSDNEPTAQNLIPAGEERTLKAATSQPAENAHGYTVH